MLNHIYYIINMLYTLNLHNVICQLYFNFKKWKKKLDCNIPTVLQLAVVMSGSIKAISPGWWRAGRAGAVSPPGCTPERTEQWGHQRRVLQTLAWGRALQRLLEVLVPQSSPGPAVPTACSQMPAEPSKQGAHPCPQQTGLWIPPMTQMTLLLKLRIVMLLKKRIWPFSLQEAA